MAFTDPLKITLKCSSDFAPMNMNYRANERGGREDRAGGGEVAELIERAQSSAQCICGYVGNSEYYE